MSGFRARLAWAFAASLTFFSVAHADSKGPVSDAPPVNPHLEEAVSHMPIPGIGPAIDTLFRFLRKGDSGGYAARTVAKTPMGDVPLQMYFFGQKQKQALLLVIDGTIQLPHVFNNHTWKRLAGSTLTDPVFSFSTVDFALDTRQMPPDFGQVVARSYFNVTSLNFTAGFQVQARVNLAGPTKKVIEQGMGIPADQFTMRAGVVSPVPTDATGSAQLAAQLAADMKDVGKTLKDPPDFFVEFQLPPGKVVPAPLGMTQMQLSDATISIDGAGTAGFRGNLIIPGGKRFITFFKTPLDPAGAMDLADFQFGVAAQTVTLEDYARFALAMHTNRIPGGSFIKGIDKYENELLLVLKPLSVFQVRNPTHVGEYRYGDITKPFPSKDAFNMLILGPFASETDANGNQLKGPYMRVAGDATILGQHMGSLKLTIGQTGLHGKISSGLKLKMGPLGRQGITMAANADVTHDVQSLAMHGNVLGRTLDLNMDPKQLSVVSPATCATPFELKDKVNLQPALDVSALLDSLPGVNVDPAKLSGCVGEDLKKAYTWVSTTGKSLGGYSANAANAELNNMANAAAAEARRQAEAAQAAYNKAKDEAREKANRASNSAMNAFRDAGNAFKKLGGHKHKHKHHKKQDPLFAASVFDWDYYYDHAQDVVKAGVDLATHWKDHGFDEGRQGSPEFSARDYLNRYPDIQQACSGDLHCALQHWLDHGIREGRQGSPDFSVRSYLARYPDLQAAFGKEGYEAALDHWINHGEDEGRDGRP